MGDGQIIRIPPRPSPRPLHGREHLRMQGAPQRQVTLVMRPAPLRGPDLVSIDQGLGGFEILTNVPGAAEREQHAPLAAERMSVVGGKSVSVRVGLGGRRSMKTETLKKQQKQIGNTNKYTKPSS